MRGLLIYLGVMLSLASASAQEFLNNDDYIYGVGATDSAAVVALSTSISVSVKSEINYAICERGKSIEESFKKDVNIFSSIVIPNSRQYVGDNGLYYRYINKTEYIQKKESEYFRYMSAVDEMTGNKTRVRKKHEINLILGNYYLAYCSMSEPLIVALLGSVAVTRSENAMYMAKSVYNSHDYGMPCIYCKEFKSYIIYTIGGYEIPETAQPTDMFAFEYFLDGKWVLPVLYSERFPWGSSAHYNTDNDSVPSKMCMVRANSSQLKYRIIYECVNNGTIMKLNVSDEWYFNIFNVRNPYSLS